MKERPIIMAADSAMAILDGRKTMTRRVVTGNALKMLTIASPDVVARDLPKWKVGDRLWVRETWKPIHHAQRHNETYVEYEYPWGRKSIKHNLGMDIPTKWRSPIFMPRWASRIILEITDVKVEQLQNITEEDAIKEGYDRRDAYAWAWNSINAKRGYPWESNPWVWVIEFKRVEEQT
jgi:hypothetical protein